MDFLLVYFGDSLLIIGCVFYSQVFSLGDRAGLILDAFALAEYDHFYFMFVF